MRVMTMRQLMYAPIESVQDLPPVDPETDPLWLEDMLDECELMDVLIDVRREYVGLLFYAAGSLYQEVGNAFLVVARQLKSAQWSDPMGLVQGEMGAHIIGDSHVQDWGTGITFECGGLFGGVVRVEGTSLSFYCVDMPGMDLPMPLYDGEDVEAIEAGVVTFDKVARPLAASHRRAGESSRIQWVSL